MACGSIKQMIKLKLTAQAMGWEGVSRSSQSVVPKPIAHATQQAPNQVGNEMLERRCENFRPMYSETAKISNLASA
jgi:hypothetical protein